MGKRLIAWTAAAALVAACAGIGAPEPTYAPFGSGSGAAGGAATSGPAAPGSTPEASPTAATWATLASLRDGAVVTLTGRVKAGFMVSCYSGFCGLDLHDAAGGDGSAIIDVRAVSAAGVPATMTRLPDPYTEADLRLTADDGSAIASGQVVTVVGTIRQGDGYTVITVEHLGRGPEPSPTPGPSARTVSFAALAKVSKGSVVRIRGRLSLPYFTFCNTRICSIVLDDPASAKEATLFVHALRGDDPHRNGMLPLPSDFKNSDLTVYTSTGKRLGYNALAWITGTLDNEPAEKERDIEVTVIEAGG
ncbi:MAG: hypothetical protein ACYDAN_07445 [Candidatus Limnocylindrales bacterium]